MVVVHRVDCTRIFCFILQSPSPDPEQSARKSSASPSEDKSLLQRWFPGWGGWYGSQPERQDSGPGTGMEPDIGDDDDDDDGEPLPKISRSELGMFCKMFLILLLVCLLFISFFDT